MISLFATIPLWYSLLGVGMEWLCIQFVKCHTGERERDNVVYWKTNGKINNDLQHRSHTQSECKYLTTTVRKVCFAGRVILLAALHSMNVSSHSSHGWYIIPISRRLSLRVLVFLNSSLMTFQSFTRFSAMRYIVSISLASTDQRFLSAAESARIFFRRIHLARI